MPRTARASVGGVIYHVSNRGNRNEAVFHKPADYDAFVDAMAESNRRLPLALLGYCLMPNHFHLVLRPKDDGDLGRWMRGLLTRHAQRYHRLNETTGHVWQGRYKAFPIQPNEHLAMVLRYVEQNPVRAELVSKAEHWKWSSLPVWLAGGGLLSQGDLSPRDTTWIDQVNDPLPPDILQRLRESVARDRPFGEPAWILQTAQALGLESSLRNRGRPRKSSG
jgi:putative transposase